MKQLMPEFGKIINKAEMKNFPKVKQIFITIFIKEQDGIANLILHHPAS